MWPYVLDWLNLVVLWFHVVAGISWIGASFYFIWLDDSLNKAVDEAESTRGISGDLWSVHGGGFYHNQKFLTGPKGEPLSPHLHWFKWEAYFTWISGVLMLAIIYWAGAGTFLIDKSVLALTPTTAIILSASSLVVGWLVYDVLCRLLGKWPMLLGGTIFAFLVFASWGLFHIFGARAAYIHVGAIIGTIMVANVFFVIIPGMKRMVAALREGRPVNPLDGIKGKIRSVHNTYLTLPVLFIMISNHYPMTYGVHYGWLVLVAIGVAGVLVRQFFILSHKQKLVYGLPAAAIAILVITAIAIAPRSQATASTTATTVTYAQVGPIFAQRCAVCHAAHPTEPGFASAPAGILLDSEAHVIANEDAVMTAAVTTHSMPLGNITNITDAERAEIGAWITGGAKP